MSSSLQKPPVFYVLAKITFATKPDLAGLVDDMAGGLASLGYPDRQEETRVIRNVAIHIQEEPVVQTEEQAITVWRFSNQQRTAGFLLVHDGLVMHTTRYQNHEIFIEDFLRGIEVVQEQVRMETVERVGLRYLNAVVSESTKKLAQMLQPHVLGMGIRFPNDVPFQSSTQTLIPLESGFLICRSMVSYSQGEQESLLPQDLLPLHLEIDPRFRGCDGWVAVLDNDCFIKTTIPYSLTGIRQNLQNLHRGADQAFELAITKHAREQWK